eukprot:91430-Rhodomonas_salina.1
MPLLSEQQDSVGREEPQRDREMISPRGGKEEVPRRRPSSARCQPFFPRSVSATPASCLQSAGHIARESATATCCPITTTLVFLAVPRSCKHTASFARLWLTPLNFNTANRSELSKSTHSHALAFLVGRERTWHAASCAS